MSQAAIPSSQAGAASEPEVPATAPAPAPLSPEAELASLRVEIDGIDDRIHDLLMQRSALAEKVLAAKRQQSGSTAPLTAADCVRPAREEEILRRLAARHRGRLDFRAVARVFREIVAAMTRIQAPISLAVAEHPGLRSLAADRFGSLTPRLPGGSDIATLRAVAEGRASFAVLPFPQEPEEDQAAWWQMLQMTGPRPLRVFLALADANGEPRAAVVGGVPLEPSGDDTTLLRLSLGQEVSRSRLHRLVQDAGIEADILLGGRAGAPFGQMLVVASGFLTAEDPRVAQLAASVEAIDRPILLGAFPRPFSPPARPGASAGASRGLLR